MTRIIKPYDLMESDKILFDLKMKLHELNEKSGNNISRNGKAKLAFKKLKYIFDNYRTMPIADISKYTNLTEHTIREYVKNSPLTIVYIKENEIGFNHLMRLITGKHFNQYTLYQILQRYNFPIIKRNENDPYLVNINEFYEWVNKHKRIIMLNNYEIGSLEDAPDWFNEKAQADKIAYSFMYKRKWTAEEDAKLKELINNGDGYKECSVTLKRTGCAIKRRCYDLQISRPKRQKCRLWSDAELAQLKELWLKGYYPSAIMEKMDRSDREIVSILERYNYFGEKPEKFVI